MDKPSTREDKFETALRRVVRVLDENRGIVTVAAVAVLLIAGAVVLRVRAAQEKEKEAWNQLATAGGDAGSPTKLRELVQRYEGTTAEFYLRVVMARRLYDAARRLEGKRDEESVQKRESHFREGVEVLEEARKRFPDHPDLPKAQKLYEILTQELAWVREHGGSLSPEAERTYARKEWTKKTEKQARKVETLDDKPGERPQVTLETERGPIVLELFEDDAPNHVANFVSIVEEGALDGRTFRIEGEGRLAAGGPRDDGAVPYVLDPEVTLHPLEEGALAMLPGEEGSSRGTAFFLARQGADAGGCPVSVFGRVLVGMDVLRSLAEGDALHAAWLDKKRMHDYEPMVRYRDGDGGSKE